MDNYQIADTFSLLSKLMDIHGENSFKVKSYAAAAFAIEKLPMQLSELAPEKRAAIKGIGDTINKRVTELLNTGQLTQLTEIIAQTPPGVLEMLSIKGIGPKKIAIIWKELAIETLGELLYACYENRLTRYKGFGEKTQKNIQESIEFYFGTLGSYLYQQIETFAHALQSVLSKAFPLQTFAITGQFRRQLPVIEQLEWVTTTPVNDLLSFFATHQYQVISQTNNFTALKGTENVTLHFYHCTPAIFGNQLFETTGSPAFLTAWKQLIGDYQLYANTGFESNLFKTAGISFIPPQQREDGDIIMEAKKQIALPTLIVPKDIKGIIHSHSNWSDGSNTIETMAESAIAQGYQYLVLSDHSKSAFYAQGLPVEKILAQHDAINHLNQQWPNGTFKIFKSIESDILSDGQLDYDEAILATFDLVIASIHSNLKMNEEKAMQRLLAAIENPYTSILGHLTGRLLLSRAGYPVDHQKIIDACAANQVVIELNAHPRRLDIDWQWIKKAIDKQVLISINPDAHSIEGYQDCKYGVLVAQKAGLTSENNLSSFDLHQMEAFISLQQKKRPYNSQ